MGSLEAGDQRQTGELLLLEILVRHESSWARVAVDEVGSDGWIWDIF